VLALIARRRNKGGAGCCDSPYNDNGRSRSTLIRRILRLSSAMAGLVLVTWIGRSLPVNATTVGFAYLLFILVIATVWGFLEACVASVVAMLTLNRFFLPPIGTFTIADPQNWVALFSFLATSLIASRLSTEARRRALDALARQRDLERLYTFSRAILLIDKTDVFPSRLVRNLAEVFELPAVVLYDRRTETYYRAGPAEFEGLDEQLRDAALQGTAFEDAQHRRTVTAVRLGSEPIAGLALESEQMPDSVLQGISNLVAIGLERARAQELEAQVEAARQSEKLRTTLLDAMAHEFKTPLTSVLAATSSLLDNPGQPPESRLELLRIADEEGRHLKELIEDTVEMGRLDTPEIQVETELADVGDLVRQVVGSMQAGIDDRPVQVNCDERRPVASVDRRLVKLAIRQLLDNALKYSLPGRPVIVEVLDGSGTITVAVTDHGEGIPGPEQSRIFERMYRSPSVESRIPGSGLGLSIALNIARAHHGDLTVTSRPGETTFRLTLPVSREGARR
jgi:two-component system, OmpR family, sensor histidine kinase KdpD